MALTLTVQAAGKSTQALLLAANYVKAVSSAAVDVVVGGATELSTGGKSYKQPATIVKALASSAKVDAAIAKKPFLAAQASQWLQFALSDAATAPSASTDVNQCLATTSYLAGPALSLADVVAFSSLHGTFAAKTASQQTSTPHLHRWFAQVQAELAAAGVETSLPPLSTPTRSFTFTTTAAEAAPAGAATGAGGEAAPTSAAAPAKGKGAAPPAAAGGEGGKKDKKAAKKDKKAAKKDKGGKQAPAADEPSFISRCEFKVGTITKAWPHPEADKLFCEEIDVGEEAPRQIASGLRDFMTLEQVQGARVLVFANLKARPFKGFPSQGMVLCASAPGKTSVEFVVPPEGVPNGEVVTFEGHAGTPDPPNRMAKKKIAEKVLPDLALSPEGVACWKGIPFMTTKGPVVASSLKEGAVG